MPVWHLSASARSGRTGDFVRVPDLVEREAIKCLRGVGGDREWWIHNDDLLVGHLRVSVTPEEVAAMPCGVAEHDAGDTGPERPRSR